MAEALVAAPVMSAIFNVLFDRIASNEVVDFFKQRKLNDEVLKKLERRMNIVSLVLEDAEEKQITKPAVRKWLDDLKDVAYNAEDLLDEIAYKAREKEIGELESELERILAGIEDLLQLKDHLNLKESDGSKSSLLSSQERRTTCLPDEVVYGRDGDKDAIIKLLRSDAAGSTYPGVVSVLGMGGIGKTTLAQLVFNDSRVKGSFDKLVWICISQEVDVIKLTKNILTEIGSSNYDSMTPNQLHLELQEEVKGQKILLVMDDVWNDIDWEFLLKPLKSVAPGSKVLVTTREERVLSKVKGVSSHQLKVLSEEECWSLFANRAFGGHSSEADADLKELGMKIIRKCKGLPLAVKTIGSLLCSERRAREWEKILESNIWDLDDGKIIAALKLSYHYLPSHLKQCFVYCAMFPKDYLFTKEELILLWMGEGFIVQNNNGRREPKEIGANYFEDLCSRSFFQKYDAYYFVMHDLLNDLAKSIAGEFCYNNVDANSGKLTDKTRRVFYKGRDGCNALEELKNISKAECLRTFICSMEKAEYRHVVDFFSRFGRLRVLRLSAYPLFTRTITYDGINMSHLDSSVKHLRYMQLYRVPILNLPETMPYLQTLIICDCPNLTSLPDSIGDMKDLRYLKLHNVPIDNLPETMPCLQRLIIEECPNLTSLPDSIGDMKDLKYLKLHTVPIVNLPETMPCLQMLIIEGCQNLTSLPDSIGDMKDLRHLSLLRMKGIKSLPNSIGNLKNLRHLDLEGASLERLPDSMWFAQFTIPITEILFPTC